MQHNLCLIMISTQLIISLGDVNLRGDRTCGELKESLQEPIKCPTSPSTTSGKTVLKDF